MEKEAICIDLGRNQPLPNITTNTVYCKRQLSLYAFNIHRFSNADRIFFLYPECVALVVTMSVQWFIHIVTITLTQVSNILIYFVIPVPAKLRTILYSFFAQFGYSRKKISHSQSNISNKRTFLFGMWQKHGS